MQHRERRLGVLESVERRGREEPLSERRGAAEPRLTDFVALGRERHLEQLAHDAERERTLELAAACREDS